MSNKKKNDKLVKVADAISAAESTYGLITNIISKDYVEAGMHGVKLAMSAYTFIKSILDDKKDSDDDNGTGPTSA